MQQTAAINQMWINVRCYNLKNMPVWGWLFVAAAAAGLVYLIAMRVKAIRKKKNK